ARAAFGALKRGVLADPADLGLDFDHFGGAGERELQRDAIADAAQVVRRDEHATRADVLREPRVEVVVAFEVDLHLEIEALRGANVLNVLSFLGPGGVHEGMLLFVRGSQASSACNPDRSTGRWRNCRRTPLPLALSPLSRGEGT